MSMSNLIQTLCTQCKKYFKNSVKSCISTIPFHERMALLLKPSTHLEVKITRKIQNFCDVSKNRFWMLYYRLSEKKICFRCDKNHKSNLCEEYIMSRIIKYIQAFDREKESTVFTQVRAELREKQSVKLDRQSQEVVTHYIKKITEQYEKKAFDFESGLALIESAILKQEDLIKISIEKRVQRYRVYHAPIVLKDLICESLSSDKELKESTLIELLHKEKFENYIRRVIESRFIDFTRSSKYHKESIEDTEIPITTQTNSSNNYDDIENILKLLSTEQQIIYKLKYAIRLNNREFLTIIYKLNYLDKRLLDRFTPEERLYIKFSVYYEIGDNSSHLSMIDVTKIKASILKKISNYREKLQSHSYIETQEEIFIKLIYTEPLSAKEMGVVFDLTSKQIDKKVENIKKRLMKLEKKV